MRGEIWISGCQPITISPEEERGTTLPGMMLRPLERPPSYPVVARSCIPRQIPIMRTFGVPTIDVIKEAKPDDSKAIEAEENEPTPGKTKIDISSAAGVK